MVECLSTPCQFCTLLSHSLTVHVHYLVTLVDSLIIIIRTSAFTSTVSPRIRMCQKTGRVGREENKNK